MRLFKVRWRENYSYLECSVLVEFDNLSKFLSLLESMPSVLGYTVLDLNIDRLAEQDLYGWGGYTKWKMFLYEDY